MKVKDYNIYNPEFPEKFPWGWVDQISLANVSATLVNHIEHDLRTADRNYVPGLRAALNVIADVAEVTTVG